MSLIIIFILGLSLGSFIGALSWRLPRDVGINKGRSVCDNCDYQLEWKDNIPVLSYLLLKGKCRKCGKKISIRYPFIELFTGLLFLSVAFIYLNCSNLLFFDSPVCFWKDTIHFFTFPYLLTASVIMVTIFIIDLEHQIVPDKLVMVLLLIVFSTVLLSNLNIYERLFSGFSAGMFLLSLNLITDGKGMGLGDGKLAIPVGMFFGLKLMVSWMFLSFLIGAVIGLLLIALDKAEFGRQIAFGPFLAVSFFVVLFFGGLLESFIFL